MTKLLGLGFRSVLILLVLNIFSHAAAAEDSKSVSRYLKDLEKFRRSVKLTPIVLSKTEYGPEDVLEPIAGFINTTNQDLIVPLNPGVTVSTSSNNVQFALAYWTIHRKDNQDIFVSYDHSKMTDTLQPMASAASDSVIKAGKTSEINFRKRTIKELNLPSGQYELVLKTFPMNREQDAQSLKKISDGNLTATQKITFTVDNPLFQKINLTQIKQNTESVVKQNESIIKKITSTLKVSKLVISTTEVKRGNSFKAECYLENPTKEEIVFILPADHSLEFCEQWYVQKLPSAKNEPKPDGGGLFQPVKLAKNNQQEIKIPAELSYVIQRDIDTVDLEPGFYETSVDITFAEKKIQTVSARFKVTK